MQSLFILILISGLFGCTHSAPRSSVMAAERDLSSVAPQHPPLPYPGGTGDLSPWGGSDSTQWRSEAIIANAFSTELNRAWAEPGVRDVFVALPVHIIPSEFFPYGDGQSNANPSFGQWKTKAPPLVATLSWYADPNRAPKVTFRFNSAFGLKALGYDQIEVSYRAQNGSTGVAKLNGHYDNGDLVADWTSVPAALDWDYSIHKGVALVRPLSSSGKPVFADSLPIYFRMPTKRVDQIISTVKQQIAPFFPADVLNHALVPDRAGLTLTDADKVFQKKIVSLDPNKLSLNDDDKAKFSSALQRLDFLVRELGLLNSGIAQGTLDFYRQKFQTILTDGRPSVLKKALFFATWPGQYNPDTKQLPYMPFNIHGDLPVGAFHIQTGVGMGWTWVEKDDTPFKIMYTCFERRDAKAEAAANPSPPFPSAEAANYGRTVASGGGWHRIGDNQETIMNTVEEGPALVAAGFSSPTSRIGFGPDRGDISYGLKDVVVARLLQPGEAFITVKEGNKDAGPPDRDGNYAAGNYHWFVFHQNTEVCTEEWVHLDGQDHTPNLLAP